MVDYETHETSYGTEYAIDTDFDNEGIDDDAWLSSLADLLESDFDEYLLDLIETGYDIDSPSG